MIENTDGFLANNKYEYKSALTWAAATIVFFLAFVGLDNVTSMPVHLFLCLLAGAVVMWVSNVMDDYIPSMLVLVSSVALGIAPVSVAFQGFASESFFLMLSLSGIGYFIVSSGIGYRFCMSIANFLKGTKHLMWLGVFIMGIFMTPLVPSVANRLQFIASIQRKILSNFNIKIESKYASLISMVGFCSVTILSSCFITSSLLNFTLFNILSLQKQSEIYAVGWSVASLPLILTMLGTALITTFVMSKKIAFPTDVSSTSIQKKREELGPMTLMEKKASMVLSFFIIMLVTVPLHRISITWMACICIIGLLATNLIDIKAWMNDSVVWKVVFSICFASGINSILLYLGMGDTVKTMVLPIFSHYITTATGAIFALILILIFVRLFIPTVPAVVLLMFLGTPVSELYEFSPWICCLVFLHAGDCWIYPYQSTLYKSYAEFLGNGENVRGKPFFIHNGIITIIRIVGLMISIPWWRKLGLL
jgi:DASS family divalent anion:Na+ symporter